MNISDENDNLIELTEVDVQANSISIPVFRCSKSH
jgi:hypothetical protein